MASRGCDGRVCHWLLDDLLGVALVLDRRGREAFTQSAAAVRACTRRRRDSAPWTFAAAVVLAARNVRRRRLAGPEKTHADLLETGVPRPCE